MLINAINNIVPIIHQYIIDEVRLLNATTSEVILSCDRNNKLNFLPGQYAYIYMEHDMQQVYSIASAPHEEHLKFIIYNGKDDKNLNFFRNNLKRPINISEPQGQAYYRETDNNILTVCKGLGIVPIMSILDSLSHSSVNKHQKISLYNVVTSKDDLIFEDYFKGMQNKINFEYKNFITDGCYNLEQLYRDFTAMHYNLNNYDFYVFGSNLFVLDIYKELITYCNNNFYSDVNIAI
ncbi:MAG: hypothetical protein AB7F64_09785 [Gammaproteobacteria bacterium]